MSLITLVLVLIIVAVLLWLVQLLPLEGTAKQILYVVIALCLLLWLLQGLVGVDVLPWRRP